MSARDPIAPAAGRAGEGEPSVLVVGSGKGGVGKSILSAALACAIARRGRRVLLLDGSQNHGNLHVMLGLRPRARLESLLAADADPQDLLVPVADGLDLMPSESGAEALYALTPLDRARLHLRLTSLYDRFETVVIDAGPGIESPMRAMIRATRLIVVAVPEPASLTDAYALVKIATLRSPGLPIDLIVNRVVSEEEAQAASSRCALAARRFLRRDLGTLGAVPEEEALRRAARVPGEILRLTIEPIERIAERLIAAAPRFEGAMAPERTG